MQTLMLPVHGNMKITVLALVVSIFSEAKQSSMEHTQIQSIFKLQHWTLPEGHLLPTYGQSLLVLEKLTETSVTKYDSCSKGHILYRNRDRKYDVNGAYQYADLQCCPIANCGESRLSTCL